MKKIIVALSCVSILLSHHLIAKTDTLSVEKAFAQKLIKLEIKGIGGYQGEVIIMDIRNLMQDSVVIHVESGRRLDSKDSTQQDILVIKDQFVRFARLQERKFTVFGFCCQAHNSSPKAKSIFSVGQMADPKLVNLAQYLQTKKLSSQIMQNAVWCISDSNEIASVSEDGTREVKELKKHLGKLRGIKEEDLPWYTIYYKKIPTQVFSSLPERITGDIDYYANGFSVISINIRNEAGTVVKEFAGTKSSTRGNQRFSMDWKVLGLPNGKYTVRIYENSRELKKLEIVVK
jgi:predicted metal-binding transcription factor (methanogenesis marker protein 9)